MWTANGLNNNKKNSTHDQKWTAGNEQIQTHTHSHTRKKNGTPIIQLKKHTPPSTTTKLQRNAEKSVFNMN